MHATKNAAKRYAKQLANYTLNPLVKPIAVKTAIVYYVAGVRGAYAMQTGKLVNAKNITVYAAFATHAQAIAHIAINKMGLYATVIAQ